MSQSQAQSNYENIEIQLITISPGEYYWSAFGHSAIRIKSPTYDRMFGFGYFDFNDEDFFFNFAQGNMQYFLGVVESEHELKGYKKEGRQVVIQNLQLTATQKRQLINKMVHLSKPENRYYHYDYFLNNCTSQIRDILDEVTGGEISAQLKSITTHKSWSDLTFPVANQAWVNIGIAYIYGLPAFSNRNQWQLSVFPELFSQDIKAIKSQDDWNNDYQIYYQPSQLETAHMQKQFFKTHYAIFLCVFILLVGLNLKQTRKATMIFWLITQSILGIGLLMLWFLTQHGIAAWNINLLLFFPFGFLLIFEKFKKPMIVNGFLVLNITWLILAVLFTNLYFIGLCLVNMIIWKKLYKS